MHTGKTFSASCFVIQHILKLQMTRGQDNGDVKVIDLAL